MNNKEKSMALFIKTQDKNTAENYLKAGFEQLNYSNGTWVFVNDDNLPLTFDNNKSVYTNTLVF